MDTNRSYEIINGPGAAKLIDAFKYAYDESARVNLQFAIPVGHTMPTGHPGDAYVCADIKNIVLTAIQHEDGPGRSFNLYGLCDIKEPWGTEFEAYQFKAYYNARTRNGTIMFRPYP